MEISFVPLFLSALTSTVVILVGGFRSFVFSENGHELLPPLSVSGTTTDDPVRVLFRRRLLEDERRYEFFRKLTPPKVGAEICKNHVRGWAAALYVSFIGN